MMNIDRPLEEIILEKRKEEATQRKQKLSGKRRSRKGAGPKPSVDKDAGGDVQMVDATMKRKPTKSIRKRRRNSGVAKLKLGKSKEVQTANGILDNAKKSFQTSPVTETKKKSTVGGVGTKVTVTNLDPAVTNIDVSELFTAVGPLKRALVVYDQNGRSTGIAEVVFENLDDALSAIKKYNGVPLDNRPLQISLATSEKGKRGGARGGASSGGFWQPTPQERNMSTFGGAGAQGRNLSSPMNPFNAPLASGNGDQNGRGQGQDNRGYDRDSRRTDRGFRTQDRDGGRQGPYNGRRGGRSYRGRYPRNRNFRGDLMMAE